MVWSARLRQHLTQVVAKSAWPVRRPDGSLGAPSTPITTAWLLRPLQGRRMLGDALLRMKITPAKRQVLQTIAGTFPGNALKFIWHLVSSPACSLCNHANESQVHIQCIMRTQGAALARVGTPGVGSGRLLHRPSPRRRRGMGPGL